MARAPSSSDGGIETDLLAMRTALALAAQCLEVSGAGTATLERTRGTSRPPLYDELQRESAHSPSGTAPGPRLGPSPLPSFTSTTAAAAAAAAAAVAAENKLMGGSRSGPPRSFERSPPPEVDILRARTEFQRVWRTYASRTPTPLLQETEEEEDRCRHGETGEGHQVLSPSQTFSPRETSWGQQHRWQMGAARAAVAAGRRRTRSHTPTPAPSYAGSSHHLTPPPPEDTQEIRRSRGSTSSGRRAVEPSTGGGRCAVGGDRLPSSPLVCSSGPPTPPASDTKAQQLWEAELLQQLTPLPIRWFEKHRHHYCQPQRRSGSLVFCLEDEEGSDEEPRRGSGSPDETSSLLIDASGLTRSPACRNHENPSRGEAAASLPLPLSGTATPTTQPHSSVSIAVPPRQRPAPEGPTRVSPLPRLQREHHLRVSPVPINLLASTATGAAGAGMGSACRRMPRDAEESDAAAEAIGCTTSSPSPPSPSQEADGLGAARAAIAAAQAFLAQLHQPSVGKGG